MIKFRWETQFQKTELGEIPRGWEVKKIRDLGKVITGKTPPTKRKEYWNNDYPFITPSDIPDYGVRYSYSVERYLSEEWAKRYSQMMIPSNAVCFVCIGSTIGKLCLSKEKSFTNQQINSIVVKDGYDPLFVFYLMRLNQFRIKEEYGGGGAAKDIISKSKFEEIDIWLPPPDEQARIAAVLSWFDDLIENKKRQNEILENTAMALFKLWFVNFEPFRDEEFVYNKELGREVPRGWAVRPIGEVAKVIMGQSPPSKYYNENGEGLPFIQGKGQMGEIIPSTTVYCSKDIKMVRAHDILVTVRAPVGELNIAERDYIIGRGIAGLKSKYWVFLYLYLRTDKERLKSYERGTTYDAITKEEIESFPLLLPPAPVLQRFHEMVEPIFRKIINNEKEIMVLKKARDALLPLLVFGKLRVEAIE